MSYNSLICVHLIPQMCNAFKPQFISRCDLHSNVNHSFLKLVKGCKLKQICDLPQFGLRETLKSCLHMFLKALQNDCLRIFTLNAKVRILWVMTQTWKILLQIIFINYVHPLSFQTAGKASCAPPRARSVHSLFVVRALCFSHTKWLSLLHVPVCWIPTSYDILCNSSSFISLKLGLS